jgi:hypothetical protein
VGKQHNINQVIYKACSSTFNESGTLGVAAMQALAPLFKAANCGGLMSDIQDSGTCHLLRVAEVAEAHAAAEAKGLRIHCHCPRSHRKITIRKVMIRKGLHASGVNCEGVCAVIRLSSMITAAGGQCAG